jgi:hypothetical protein
LPWRPICRRISGPGPGERLPSRGFRGSPERGRGHQRHGKLSPFSGVGRDPRRCRQPREGDSDSPGGQDVSRGDCPLG